MVPAAHPQARIVVVDDEQPNLHLLDRTLARKGSRHVVLTTDGRHLGLDPAPPPA